MNRTRVHNRSRLKRAGEIRRDKGKNGQKKAIPNGYRGPSEGDSPRPNEKGFPQKVWGRQKGKRRDDLRNSITLPDLDI